MADHFHAEIQLLRTEDGGRAVSLASSEWRAVLGVAGQNWSARLVFSGSPSPGETFQASVKLLLPEAFSQFPMGAVFTVWEGDIRATGRVVSHVALI